MIWDANQRISPRSFLFRVLTIWITCAGNQQCKELKARIPRQVDAVVRVNSSAHRYLWDFLQDNRESIPVLHQGLAGLLLIYQNTLETDH